MPEQLDITGYAHALGRYEASWHFASAELRRAAALRAISMAWDTYRRDAGPGDVGLAHEQPVDAQGVLRVDDPRRDAVLLWLADHGAPEIAEAAATLARMMGATGRFNGEQQSLVHEASDAAASPPGGPIARSIAEAADDAPVVGPLMMLARAVDCLRGSDAFLEAAGEDVFLPVPGGAFSHYVPAVPGATWALNLALLTSASPFARVLPVSGLTKRALCRADAEPDELAAELIATVTAALGAGCEVLEQLHAELARGRTGLAHLSRNSRAREAWLLVAALGSVTRLQLVRALSLSRAGGDIQARALADAGLVRLGAGGRVDWIKERLAERLSSRDHQPANALGAAVADLDASMAAIDRLLARTPR